MKSNTVLFRKPVSRVLSEAARSEAKTRSEFVYLQLRDALTSGALKPGERVMEVEVAEWLQVSRTPVREALHRLESEGLLRIEPRLGLVVASISRGAMRASPASATRAARASIWARSRDNSSRTCSAACAKVFSATRALR